MVKQIEEHYCDRCGDLIEKPHAGVEIPGTHPSMVGYYEGGWQWEYGTVK